MRLGIAGAVIVILIVLYAVWGRGWLKSKPWAERFFAWIEPFEIVLYKKSEAILLARTKMAIGALLTVLSFIGSINLDPLMPFVPDEYEPLLRSLFNLIPMALTLLGMADERLRNKTTKPIELVALPDKVVNENPRVAEAVAMAETTKTEAVAVVAQQKAA